MSRLTREEYAAAIRDLLGVSDSPSDPAGLPEDENWLGIERIGAGQTTLKWMNQVPGFSVLAVSGRPGGKNRFTTIREGRAP